VVKVAVMVSAKAGVASSAAIPAAANTCLIKVNTPIEN
jgi:hypothetical protein